MEEKHHNIPALGQPPSRCASSQMPEDTTKGLLQSDFLEVQRVIGQGGEWF